MADGTEETATWMAPWWFIVAVSLVLGLGAGGGSVLIDGLGSGPASLPRWLSFMIGFTVVGGGTRVQLYLRRRAELRAI
jgi:hypothetical protein